MVKSQSTGEVLLLKRWDFAAAFFISACLVSLACVLCPPLWETNDDVSMAMIAHGYGVAAMGTPKILFSNVLWGDLVRLLPTLGGIDGYSLAVLGALVISGAVMICSLRSFRVGVLASAAVLTLILLRAVLRPQFTVTAGLLAVVAVLCWQLYARTRNWRVLIMGCVLALLAYLERAPEFLLVIVVAAPLISWRSLVTDRAGRIALIGLATAIAVAAVVDHQAYETPDWQAFNELNSARAPLTDYHAGASLKEHPEILRQHGYSINDINLVQDWFFVDPKLTNPVALEQMVSELGPLPARGNAPANIWVGISALWSRFLLPLVCAALLLAFLRPNWRLAASWVLFLAAVVGMGLAGRPGIFRVYVPPVSLLLITPLIMGTSLGWRHHLELGALSLAALINCVSVVQAWQSEHQASVTVQRALTGFPVTPVVIWGDAFPFEEVYPVLGVSAAAKSYQLYGLGVSTLAPFSRASVEQNAGRGLLARLTSEQGVAIIADEGNIERLRVYCQEHMRGELQKLSSQRYGDVVVQWQRCESTP